MDICKYCGAKNARTAVSCSKSPTGRHYPISDPGSYVCECCGSKSGTGEYLCNGGCSKSPTKYHIISD